MVRARVIGVGLIAAIICALLLPRAASAQQASASGIAGVVGDGERGHAGRGCRGDRHGTLPRDFVVSAVFQNISGPTITASYAASNAEIAPSLRRNLAACGARASCTSTATIPLIAPQTMFDDRLSRLDLRFAKRIAVSQRTRLQANFNIYNVFNGSASSTLNTTYGPQWLQPSLLQDGRMVQFSAMLTF